MTFPSGTVARTLWSLKRVLAATLPFRTLPTMPGSRPAILFQRRSLPTSVWSWQVSVEEGTIQAYKESAQTFALWIVSCLPHEILTESSSPWRERCWRAVFNLVPTSCPQASPFPVAHSFPGFIRKKLYNLFLSLLRSSLAFLSDHSQPSTCLTQMLCLWANSPDTQLLLLNLLVSERGSWEKADWPRGVAPRVSVHPPFPVPHFLFTGPAAEWRKNIGSLYPPLVVCSRLHRPGGGRAVWLKTPPRRTLNSRNSY